MLGLMQNWPLLVSKLIEHADNFHGKSEIVTLTVEGGTHRYTWSDCHVRSKKVAQALHRMGVGEGDIIGTLAWNTYRHVELWYGISGMGAVAHTINPRLFKDQLIYIANHAEDKVLFLDTSFVPIIEAVADELPNIEAYIFMTDEEHMPETTLKNVYCYETLVEAEDGNYSWPELDENLASGLCYTSGTTGNPKGVLYSHRSNFLHTLVSLGADALGATAKDVFFPVVPMFHANAWGVPYCAAAVGCKLALAGPHFDGETLQKFIEDEGVSLTAAVPTVWLALLGYLQSTGKGVGDLKRVVIGGSAAPRSMIQSFEDDYGVEVSHAWGMTETSPLGSVGSMTRETATWSKEKQLDVKCKQGRPVLGIEMEILDDDGNALPHDGKAFGHLVVRGPWVVREYMKAEGGEIIDENGWFDTGDVSTLDELGFMQITDRSKDVIKSGGEWISSIELENAAVGHPDVAEAGVIGIFHPKWNERPLLILVLNEGATLDKDSIIKCLEKSVAKWWLPDDIITVDELPHTATGKILKMELREMYKDYKFPNA